MSAVGHTVATMLGVCSTVKWVSHSVSVTLASVVMASAATLSVSVHLCVCGCWEVSTMLSQTQKGTADLVIFSDQNSLFWEVLR